MVECRSCDVLNVGLEPKTKILFVDFTSAFNTMQPNILADILASEFNLNTGIIYWIMNFLNSRVQRVRVGSFLSDAMTTSTGSPQGCVLSPLLFILYTNSCTSTLQYRHFIKYADDTALVSLLRDEEVDYGPVLDSFLE